MSILDNYNRIKDSVKETATKFAREPECIKIIAVSKTFNVEIIQEAINSGIQLLGENKVQEAKNKASLLTGDYKFHMIGHLQSNKCRDAVLLFDLIHSIDKLSTAEKLNTEALKIKKIQKILLQIKTTNEITQSGVSINELFPLVESVLNMKHLKIEGLMNIGPNINDLKKVRQSFVETAKTLEIINTKFNLKLRELSMGMSGDYITAIQEGATLIRIGTAIFGKRSYI
jgi:pyridoxal phosphate enzyme (YggS family)